MFLKVYYGAIPYLLPGCHHDSIPAWLSNQTNNSSPGTSGHCSSDFVPYLQCPVRQNYLNLRLRQRSTCPWVKCLDTDPLREPRDIPYARCLCMDCTGRSSRHACLPVYHTIRVKRIAGCDDTGAFNFTLEDYRMSVGCTCARKRI